MSHTPQLRTGARPRGRCRWARPRAQVLESRLAPAGMLASFSSYLGGSQFDSVRDVTTDTLGNVYVTGGTASANFPTTVGAYQRILNPGIPDGSATSRMDVIVAKFSPGGQLVWSTLLGGPNYDRAYAIDIDPQGNVVVAGRAGANFPVSAGTFQTSFQGGTEGPYGNQDGFIAKLSPDGSQLLWASYFGTVDASVIRDIDLDTAGNVYLASSRLSGTYPSAVAAAFTGRFQASPVGSRDNVVAKVAADGSQVVWASYIGGTGSEAGEPSIGVDAAGQPYLATYTSSTNIPTTNGAYDRTYNGGGDMYLAKFTADGTGLVYSTYFGGAAPEFTETHSLVIDAQGVAVLAAMTLSPDLPTTPGAFQTTYAGSGGSGTGAGGNYPGDGFVARFSADGSQLLAGTFIGGALGDGIEGVNLDGAGNVYVTGSTYSSNFPVTPDAYQLTKAAGADAFAAKLSPSLGLLYGTYFGGSGEDFARDSWVDANGAFCLGGESSSTNWPLTNPFDPTFNGGSGDAIFARLTPPAPAVAAVVLNDGSPQRSRVTSIVVSFDSPVTFAGASAAAFSLGRVGGSGLVTFNATPSLVGGRTVVTLSNFTGANAQFGSLIDGRYTLSVLAGQVSSNGITLDGNGDGTAGDNYVVTGAPGVGPKLYRLFGDTDGDGDVDVLDFRSMRLSFLGQVNLALDFDGDGHINATDFTAFRVRFASNI